MSAGPATKADSVMNLSRVPSSRSGNTPFAATQASPGAPSPKPAAHNPKPAGQFGTVNTYGGAGDFEALPQAYKDAIKASPMVQRLGMEPHAMLYWAGLERKGNEGFDTALGRLSRHVNLSSNDLPIPNSEKFQRFRLPTNPDLPPAPKTPTPATNIGGRRSN